MKTKLTFKDKKIDNFEELLSLYGKKEFASPYRSTIPLIELFFRNVSELEKIIPNYESFTCSFEYETKVLYGKGKVSCTDLMIYNDEKAYCIEAKRTEPAYQSVKKWLEKGKRENKKLVLSGWLELINNKCGTNLKEKDVKHFPYQVIHRFASACKIGINMRERNVQLFYFFFDEANSNIEYYKNVLLELSELVNNSVIIKSFVFRIEETENYKIIENLWNKRTGKLDLSNDIKRLLIREKCMSIYRAEFNLGETSWKEISIDEL